MVSLGARASVDVVTGLVTWRYDLPGPGIELMYPALEGGFLTPGPPGKSEVGDVLNLPL